jgi:hypothetical protein
MEFHLEPTNLNVLVCLTALLTLPAEIGAVTEQAGVTVRQDMGLK